MHFDHISGNFGVQQEAAVIVEKHKQVLTTTYEFLRMKNDQEDWSVLSWSCLVSFQRATGDGRGIFKKLRTFDFFSGSACLCVPILTENEGRIEEIFRLSSVCNGKLRSLQSRQAQKLYCKVSATKCLDHTLVTARTSELPIHNAKYSRYLQVPNVLQDV